MKKQAGMQEKPRVLEAVVWVICWIARFKRPAIALDVLGIASGLIFEPEKSITGHCRKASYLTPRIHKAGVKSQKEAAHSVTTDSRHLTI